jgi:hypothetical protein
MDWANKKNLVNTRETAFSRKVKKLPQIILQALLGQYSDYRFCE